MMSRTARLLLAVALAAGSLMLPASATAAKPSTPSADEVLRQLLPQHLECLQFEGGVEAQRLGNGARSPLTLTRGASTWKMLTRDVSIYFGELPVDGDDIADLKTRHGLPADSLTGPGGKELVSCTNNAPWRIYWPDQNGQRVETDVWVVIKGQLLGPDDAESDVANRDQHQ